MSNTAWISVSVSASPVGVALTNNASVTWAWLPAARAAAAVNSA